MGQDDNVEEGTAGILAAWAAAQRTSQGQTDERGDERRGITQRTKRRGSAQKLAPAEAAERRAECRAEGHASPRARGRTKQVGMKGRRPPCLGMTRTMRRGGTLVNAQWLESEEEGGTGRSREQLPLFLCLPRPPSPYRPLFLPPPFPRSSAALSIIHGLAQ